MVFLHKYSKIFIKMHIFCIKKVHSKDLLWTEGF